MALEVRVQYFAAARELCGCSEERIAWSESASDIATFARMLAARHPRLAPFVSRMRFAINGELVSADERVAAGDEVAVLPPVAGGTSSRVVLAEIRASALSVDELLAAVRAPDAGGIALFVGCVRDYAEGKSVARLDYEAHPELAARELFAILEELAVRTPALRLAAVHRTGELAIGELAVIVAASAPHRAEAFAACREAIELIKQRVAIWKKEHWADGSASWVNFGESETK